MSVSNKNVNNVVYKSLSIPDAEVITKLGLPQVPVITKLIAIPDCDNVSISITPSNEFVFSNYNILPAPRFEKKKLPDDTERMEEVFEEDQSVYSSANNFPGKKVEIIELGYCRDQKVARVAIYPVQFNPVAKTIQVFTDYNINLSFSNPYSAINKELGIFRNVMHNAALNYTPSGISASMKINNSNSNIFKKDNPKSIESGSITRVTNLSTLVGSSALPVDYLIITHSSLFNSSVLTILANHRSDYNGYDVVICQVDASGPNNDIYDFEDTPGHIKYPSTTTTRYVSVRDFIADVYLNGRANNTGDGHLAYICLVGDALQDDNTNVMVPAATPSIYGTFEQGGDYYYACTGGDNDSTLDLMYGRIPVGNETELNNVVNKIISYESNSNGSWNNDYTFVSFSPDLFSYYSNPAMASMTSIVPPTYQKSYAYRAKTTDPASLVTEADPIFAQRFTQAQYGDPGNLCGSDLLNDWLYNNVNAGLNNGIHTFVYEGHGGWNSLGANEGCGRFIFYLNDVNCHDPSNANSINNRLNNNLYSFMIFNCCDAGHLDHGSGDCVSEVVLNFADRGAIGVLSSSRDSYASAFGDVDKKVLQAMYTSLSHIMGEAVFESKLNMDDLYRRQYNLYGDPAVNLWPTGYTISENITISEDAVISENITVAPGVTLTITPGVDLRFTNSSSLIVNGSLIANGTSANKITFDFIEQNSTTSNGIKVNLGGTLTLSNAIVKNAYKGIDLVTSSSSSLISASIIQNCRDGINIQYGSRVCDLTISSNQIRNNSNFGIYINNQEFNMTSEFTYISNNYIESCNYGIYMTGNVSAGITFSTIENCTQGIYIYDAQPRIIHNTILNPSENGIYCNSPGKSPQIIQSIIKKGSDIPSYQNFQGIWVENNTTAYIMFNDISGFCWGIYCGGGVNSYFTDANHQLYSANNRMRDNLIGFAAGWGSYIMAGYDDGFGYFANCNSTYGNSSYDVVSYEYSYIEANYNFWGDDEPNIYCDETSGLDTSYRLNLDPWGEQRMHAGLSGTIPPKEGGYSNIIKGIILEKNGQINDAIKHYKQMISKNSFADFALTELAKFRNKYPVTNLSSYFNTLVSSNNIHKEKLLRILAAIYLGENKYDEAMQTYTSIINQYPNSRNSVYARFEKFYATLNHAQDLNAAGQLLQEIRSLGITDEEFLMKLNFAETLYNNESGSGSLGKSNVKVSQKQTQPSIPNEYALLGNYPNPFNPTTTISYALSFDSEVLITIFDLTGRVIKTMNISNQSTGYKTVLWDGRNDSGEPVSSGVYIYTVKAVSLEGNGKAFSKSSKLMLLK